MRPSAEAGLGALRIPSPLGELLLLASPRGLAALRFCDHDAGAWRAACPAPSMPEDPVIRRQLAQAREELAAYFAGRLHAFTLPLDVRGTPFQQRVWQALRDIPYGETRSYAQLAADIGQPHACRAVGNANGKNPLPIIIPCHRVIHAGGGPGGYSAGLDVKRFLLALEAGGHKKSPLAGA